MQKINGNHSPAGMKDLLPGEAIQKRFLEDLLAAKFSAWGYQEAITPVLEFYENLLSSGAPPEQLFKMIDRQGQILALRPDMTTPIARMAAGKINPEHLPQRIFYAANVFRYESPQMGRQREFFQAGVELIGVPGPDGDAEVIALAAESLRDAGLKEFQVSVGHVGFLRGMVSRLGLESSVQEKIIKVIYRKDFVHLDMLLESNGVRGKEKEMLLSLPSLRGGAEVLDQAAGMIGDGAAAGSLEAMRDIFRLLKVYGVDKQVFLDFGISRNLNYYSGVIFEAYCPGLGAPLCGGGRYDNLLGKYGLDAPATGFAIGLERLMIALGKGEHQDMSAGVDYLIISNDQEAAIKKAQELRREGYRVSIAGREERIPPGAKKIIQI